MTVTCPAKAQDTVLVTLTLQHSPCSKVTFATGKQETTLYAGIQKTVVGIPVHGDALPVTVTGEGVLEARCENLGDTPMESLWKESGPHMLDFFFSTPIPDTCAGVDAVKDMVKAGRLMITVGGHGKMTVLDVSDPQNPRKRSEITGMGYNIRQIALCKSGEDVIITSREEGAYIVNTSHPENPYIRSRYNSVELATGLSVSGDLAFITNRQFGVEAVDISDLDAPRHICIIPTGEAQGCLASGRYLYCGLWNQRRVDIFDISDLNNVTLAGSAPLSGKGDGFTVCHIDGKTYLYAATGQHSSPPAKALDDLSFGFGNGLDILDITDPQNPIWLSTSRIDGRYYFPENDDWRANVSLHNGKVFAYVVNSYNGLYLFDVTDPRRPRRLQNIYIPITPDSPKYQKQLFPGVPTVFPFDQDAALHGPMSRIFAEEGRLYIAGSMTDLHIADCDFAFPLYDPPEADIAIPEKNTAHEKPVDLPGWKLAEAPGQTFAIAEEGGKLFVAAGYGGIAVYDTELNLLQTHKTAGCCFDVFLRNGILYAAEGEGGAAAYEICGTNLRKIWDYQSPEGVCRSIKVSATGKFAVLEISDYVFELINTATKEVLQRRKHEFLMYNRTMLSTPDGRYIGFYRRPIEEIWYDCGENDSFDVPVKVAQLSGKTYSAYGGGAWVGSKILAFTQTGYRLYDPFSGTDPMELPIMRPEPLFSGKPTVAGSTLVVTNRMKQQIHLANCTDMENLQHRKTVSLPGSPDQSIVVGSTVYVPLGYMGMAKFDL